MHFFNLTQEINDPCNSHDTSHFDTLQGWEDCSGKNCSTPTPPGDRKGGIFAHFTGREPETGMGCGLPDATQQSCNEVQSNHRKHLCYGHLSRPVGQMGSPASQQRG